MAISLSGMLAVLVVIAHPDDETMFTGLIHALTHKLNASVDLVCITNGEGGFKYAGLSESFYGNLELSNEKVARKHLPRIRPQELFGSGRILGIRKYFFYDQMDLEYSKDVDTVYKNQWDKEWVIEQLQRTIKTGNGADGYDLMVVILPSTKSHGHHSASALLALDAIHRLQETKPQNIRIPAVIGGSEFVLTQSPSYSKNPIAVISNNTIASEFRFNLKWKVTQSVFVDYKTVRLWIAAEHKSQGSLIEEMLRGYDRDEEQYFYFAINDFDNNKEHFKFIESLFTQLALIHQNDSNNKKS